jgi:hypothetical protein
LRTGQTLNFMRPSTQNLATGHRPPYGTLQNPFPDNPLTVTLQLLEAGKHSFWFSDRTLCCQNEAMNIENWWPLLSSSTQQWLIDNNGDVVPPSILDQITAVAGHPTAEASWVADNIAEEFLLSDQAIDWIEEAANNENSGGE